MLLSALLAFTLTTTAKQAVLADPALAKHVTYTTRAENAVLALKGLGDAAGVKLDAAPVMKQEILVLKLNAVPLPDTMKRIANAAGGSWKKDKDTFWLVRTEADESRRVEARKAKFRLALQEMIDAARKRLADEPTFDAAEAERLALRLKNEGWISTKGSKTRMYGAGGVEMPLPPFMLNSKVRQAVDAEQPGERLADQILSSLDVEDLLATPYFIRTVFSTNPSRYESKLNFDVTGAVRAYVECQNLWSQTLARVGHPAELDGYLSNVGQPAPQGIAKVDVVNGRSIELIGSDGMILRTIMPPPGPQHQPGIFAGANRPPMPGFRLSAEEKLDEHRTMLGLGLQDGGLPITPELRHRLERPDQFEPLAMLPSTLILQAAEVLHKNVVADVPDSWISVGADFTLRLSNRPDDWLKSVTASIPCTNDDQTIEIDGGAMEPCVPDDIRADRNRLAKLLTSGREGWFTAEEIGDYAFSSGEYAADALVSERLGLALETAPMSRISRDMSMRNQEQQLQHPGHLFSSITLGSSDWGTLKLLGALRSGGGDAALESNKSTFGVQSSDVQALLENELYYHVGTMKLGYLQGTGDFNLPMFELADVFPQGIPSGASLDLAVNKRTVVFEEGDDITPWTAEEMAMHATGDYPAPAFFPGVTTSGRFRPSLQREFSWTLTLGPRAQAGFSLADPARPSNKAVNFVQLPKEFVDTVNDYVRRSSNSPNAGRQIIPPGGAQNTGP